MSTLQMSELVLNDDQSVYHLKLKEEHIADHVIVVGDQNRVHEISKHFSHIECKISNREFVTHTGTFQNKRITVLSTGIGTDNIDIVVNELDAAVNIDPLTREIRPNKRSLNLIRIGTCGALQEFIPVDSFIASSHSIGIDGTLNFYKREKTALEQEIIPAFIKHTGLKSDVCLPYFTLSNKDLFQRIASDMTSGITLTANGFYGPQGRKLRLDTHDAQFNDKIPSFEHQGLKIVNYEMETSALYGLGSLLGHSCLTCCVVVANRYAKQFSKNYKIPMEKLIRTILERI